MIRRIFNKRNNQTQSGGTNASASAPASAFKQAAKTKWTKPSAALVASVVEEPATSQQTTTCISIVVENVDKTDALSNCSIPFELNRTSQEKLNLDECESPLVAKKAVVMSNECDMNIGKKREKIGFEEEAPPRCFISTASIRLSPPRAKNELIKKESRIELKQTSLDSSSRWQEHKTLEQLEAASPDITKIDLPLRQRILRHLSSSNTGIVSQSSCGTACSNINTAASSNSLSSPTRQSSCDGGESSYNMLPNALADYSSSSLKAMLISPSSLPMCDRSKPNLSSMRQTPTTASLPPAFFNPIKPVNKLLGAHLLKFKSGKLGSSAPDLCHSMNGHSKKSAQEASLATAPSTPLMNSNNNNNNNNNINNQNKTTNHASRSVKSSGVTNSKLNRRLYTNNEETDSEAALVVESLECKLDNDDTNALTMRRSASSSQCLKETMIENNKNGPIDGSDAVRSSSQRVNSGFFHVRRARSLSFVSCKLNLTILGSDDKSLLLGRFAGIQQQHDKLKHKFPKAKKQLERQLSEFVECELREIPLSGGVDMEPAARFVYSQIIEMAKLCLNKSRLSELTCAYFDEITSSIELLLAEAKQKCSNVDASLKHLNKLVNRFLLIISRVARLLECLEFNPFEFVHMLDAAEQQTRRTNVFLNADDIPKYIISKLGLANKIDPFEEFANRVVEQNKITTNVKSELTVYSRDCAVQQQQQQQQQPCEEDFENIKLISNGAYGAVHLVRHKQTCQRFAMKKIKKQNILWRNQLQQVYTERDIMIFTDNPFVVALICTFETRKYLCMVMEYVEGGDVATLIKNMGPLPFDMARVYFAETTLAVEYLHNYGIIHRDLKPDNLLITSLGHIKLTDFGLSKIGLMNLTTNFYEGNVYYSSNTNSIPHSSSSSLSSSSQSLFCNSYAQQQQQQQYSSKLVDLKQHYCKEFNDKQIYGTPQYVAPEVILRQPYGKPVDWWSMGVILYEFLTSVAPFNGKLQIFLYKIFYIFFQNLLYSFNTFDNT
jgi:tRNA A-37 threonylcarbamoyl transferase component Bud32